MKKKREVWYIRNQKGNYYKFTPIISLTSTLMEQISFVVGKYRATKFLEETNPTFIVELRLKELYPTMTFTVEKGMEEYECKSTHIWRRTK